MKRRKKCRGSTDSGGKELEDKEELLEYYLILTIAPATDSPWAMHSGTGTTSHPSSGETHSTQSWSGKGPLLFRDRYPRILPSDRSFMRGMSIAVNKLGGGLELEGMKRE